MGENSKIEWTSHTFNPWIGCAKIAPGCVHCYAEDDMDRRRHRVRWGVNGTRSVTSGEYWKQPARWNRQAECIRSFDCSNGDHSDACPQSHRPRVFCASLADVFEDREELELWRANLFDVIDETPNLDWLLLTKRPANILRMWPEPNHTTTEDFGPKPRPNVWLGTSISDQETADSAIPELVECRGLSDVLFLSAEPLLGPVDLDFACARRDIACIDWVIIGGESGPAARRCDARWIIDIADQCRNAGVPAFIKQLGANAWLDSICFDDADPGSRLKLSDKKGGNWVEWPADVPRVREFPNVKEH